MLSYSTVICAPFQMCGLNEKQCGAASCRCFCCLSPSFLQHCWVFSPFFQSSPPRLCMCAHTHACTYTFIHARTHTTHSHPKPSANIAATAPLRYPPWAMHSPVAALLPARVPLRLCAQCPGGAVGLRRGLESLLPQACPQLHAAAIMWIWSSPWVWQLSLSVFSNKLFKWDVEELIG